MNDISMSRSGRSKYTREDIFKALVKNQSLEFGYNNDLTYNIHLDDEGNILWGMKHGIVKHLWKLLMA